MFLLLEEEAEVALAWLIVSDASVRGIDQREVLQNMEHQEKATNYYLLQRYEAFYYL